MDITKKKKNVNWPVIIVWIGVLFCSQSSTFVRFSTAPSLVLAAYRKIMVTVILLPFVWISHRDELKDMGIKQFILCTLSGIFLGIHFYTYFESVKMTTIAASQVLCGLEVLYVALFMFLIGKERYSRLATAGIVVALAGSVLVAYTGSNAGGQTSLAGNLTAIFSGICLATYSLIGSKVRATCSNTLYTFLVYGFAAITLTLGALISGVPFFGYDKINYLTAFGMVICCSLLGHSIFNWSLKYLSPTLLAMIKITSPIFAALAGVLFFLEIPAWNQILGGLVVMAGIFLYTYNKSK